MKNLFTRGAPLGWRPNADAFNASEGALLRADNLTLDETGALALRMGSARTYGSLTSSTSSTNVHSLYTAQIEVSDVDTTYDAAVCYDTAYVYKTSDGSLCATDTLGLADGDGVSVADDDVSFGDDSYQIFMARGISKRKWDGKSIKNWGIAAPSGAPTLTAATIKSTQFWDFDASEAIAGTVTVHEGTGSAGNADGHEGTANGSTELTPSPKTGRATISKIFTTVQDCHTIQNAVGGDTDLIDFYVYIEEPKKVDKITLMFGLTNSATDPFKTDYYYFDFDLKNAEEIKLKNAEAYGTAAYARLASTVLDIATPEDVTKVKTPAEAKKILRGLEYSAGSRSRVRADPSQASPAWTHFTVPRGQMHRHGTTNALDWKTVKGIKIVYDAVKGSDEKVRFEDLKIIGGGDKALTGTFKALYRYANYSSSGAYYELSPVSPISTEVVLSQQALSITLPSTISEADQQVDQIWIYLMGGFLNTFYRVAVIPFTTSTGYWSLDEFTRAADGSPAPANLIRANTAQAGGDTDKIKLDASASAVDDYYNNMLITITAGTSVGDHRTISDYDGTTKVATVSAVFTATPDATSKFAIHAAATALTAKDIADLRIGMGLEMGAYSGTAPNTITYALKKSELDILIDGEVLEPGTIGIPDNVIAIAGPWRNRMYMLTKDGYIYPTMSTSPSNCSVFHTLDVRRYGMPKWMVLTNGGVYAGLTKDVVRLGGTGNESDDKALVDLFPEPLNLASPPVDACVYTDGNSIIYRSSDGLMALSGVSVVPVPAGETSLLWRGQDRHDISALNTSTGRFRLSVDHQIAYLLVTEGTGTTPTALWRYNMGAQSPAWERFTYQDTLLSIFQCDDGRLLAGTSSGAVLELEKGAQDYDHSNTLYDIPVNIRWPWLDGGNPLVRKAALDLQIHANTGSDTATVSFYVDGSSTAAASFSVLTSMDTVYRCDATGIGNFLHVQPRLTGSFGEFKLRLLNLSFRPMVQHAMVVDTDYIIPPEPNDMVWLQEAEVDCISPSNLTLYMYIDDTLYTTQTVTVSANKRSVYIVPLPRGTKGRRPRAVIKTTASDGAGSIGFECFRVRFREVGSGNFFEVPFQVTQPVGA